jgi:hypothetical protein
LGVWAAIVGVSIVLFRLALEWWIAILRVVLAGAVQASFETVGWYLAMPLLPRLVVAAILTVGAALTDRHWLVPIAVVIALPVIWLNGFAVLAAVVPLWLARTRAVDERHTATVAGVAQP